MLWMRCGLVDRVKPGAVVGCGGRSETWEHNTRGEAILSDDLSLGIKAAGFSR